MESSCAYLVLHLLATALRTSKWVQAVTGLGGGTLEEI